MVKLLILFLILVFIIKNTYFKENLIGFDINYKNENNNFNDVRNIPVLTFQSTKDCPILYTLFKDLKDTSKRLDYISKEEKEALNKLENINIKFIRTKITEIKEPLNRIKEIQSEINELETKIASNTLNPPLPNNNQKEAIKLEEINNKKITRDRKVESINEPIKNLNEEILKLNLQEEITFP